MKILLACAGGMSTGMLVQKMVAYAKSQGIEAEIAAYGLGELKEVVAGTDVILLGPQIGFQQEEVQQKYPTIPVAVIDKMDYAMMNGEKAFKLAQKLMANEEE
jgi:PTS system cellobiose-specific IIB component